MFLFGFVLAAAAAFFPFAASADNYGDKAVFSIDKNYDSAGRRQAAATLVWVGEKIYFYADDLWWNGLNAAEREKYNLAFKNLDAEFSRRIQPKLNEIFGASLSQNLSHDGKTTLLIHPMVKDAGGYINTGDGYSKYQAPASNEREMVYFNTRFIDVPLAKAYLAHEYVHLITFNQKDILRRVADDVWLNEARADYSSTILGYDVPFAGSNFDQRVKSFAADSSKSLTEWQNVAANYGAAHLFVQYLVDHYGIAILVDSMQTDKTGIASIEYALEKNGFAVSFRQVFRDWLIALAVNDCGLGQKYCYKTADLKPYAIAPKINYLPNSENVSLSVMYNTFYFSGNWQKIIGGSGNLRLDFSAEQPAGFVVPYIACRAGGQCDIGDLETSADGNAVLNLADFGKNYVSLVLMPFAAGKTFGFDRGEPIPVSYSFRISVAPKTVSGQTDIVAGDPKIQQLLAQIEALKKEIARIQTILAGRARNASLTAAALKNNPPAGYSCSAISADLYFGVENYRQVYCLQEFLKNQGAAIYPQGTVSGRFSAETRTAVVKFQEKYTAEILTPQGLKSGTGYVGAATRAKINNLMK